MTTPTPGDSTRALKLQSDIELLRIALAGDYEIIEELGRGGMAIVFRAREKALVREVAIKVLPAHHAQDKAFVDRFEHEARTAALLEHPNIIPIHRVGRAGPNGEIIYFVMKLLRGQSLSAMLQERGKLAPVDVRRILLETAAALDYAARHGVVHRDIKPDNILFDNEGRSVITDFGIAKAPGGYQSIAGTLVGSPRYMSPEHALSDKLDGRSDIYGLGVVAYQCLFGQPPFDGDDPLKIIGQHIHEPVPVPPLWTDEERELYTVIGRMLAKQPVDRFQSGNDVVAALGGQIANAPPPPRASTATPASTATTSPVPTSQLAMVPVAPPVPTPMSRTERRVWVGMGVAAAVVIGGFAIDQLRSSSARTATVAPDSTSAARVARASTQQSAPTPAPARSAPAPIQAPPVVLPKAPPKARPSARAAAIIAYNGLRSSCAKRDTLASAKPIAFAVLVDSIRDRTRSDKMEVTYDVCGLESASRFTTTFTLTKRRQRGFGQQKPRVETAVESAGSPRSRERRTLDTREMSAGSYRLDVVVTDTKKNEVRASREFQMSDK